ncbi:MAG: glycosyltransferase [bacterium]|nr:glycosyltransferase [bacterium]
MRLLILTQKVDLNDDVLGFMHGWIAEFARQCESVTVVCLYKGQYLLPANVKVLSLGKEEGVSRFKYIFNFYRYIWQERKNYDSVFVHMNPEYIVLGGLFWRLWGKTISLWYAHGYVPLALRVAEKFTNIIFTSTVSGCRLDSKKIKVIGQGIDTDKFSISNFQFKNDDLFKIVTVGRIAPAKDQKSLVLAADILRSRGLKFKVNIIGGLGLADQSRYFDELKQMALEKNLGDVINFVGPVANEKILPYLHEADLFVNMGLTGSLDKVVPEAMSAGLPILTCNEALIEVLGDYTDRLMYPKADSTRLADKIQEMTKLTPQERQKIGQDLREIVVKDHSLKNFVGEIVKSLA